MGKIKTNTTFEKIVRLIEEARNRAFHKVNEELVLLYFKVGNIVSDKVSAGAWGDNTVDELAVYIASKYPGLQGFNRRGLYRMKQFFETYTTPEFVSTVVTKIKKAEKEALGIVSALLTQISWTHHLLILSKTRTTEEKLFYIHACINEHWSTRELERQLNSAVFERTVLANKKVPALMKQLPQNLFKDPYVFEFLDLPDGHSETDLDPQPAKNHP